ncbi:hypothetical protein [Roseomonas chloroacetimidivorans]|uniref:hypothetical protein n=1 Tax=Roseomonas chloroacetimidivorans TaxID=1766656 RepID=UPI003C78324D
MPGIQNIPARNLSQYGIVRDAGTYNLPLNAFTGGANVRFQNGAVRDAPVWRLAAPIDPADPAFAFGVRTQSDFDEIFYTTKTGRIRRFLDRSDTDVTQTVWTEIVSDLPFTGTTLGGVVYINRETHVPQFRLPTGTKFANLSNWDSTWRCKSLRAYKDFLIALNVTKNGVANPFMVKWSNLTLAGQVPNSWDATVIANNVAGENVLTDATAPIIDGGPLRDNFLIYTGRETFLMRYVQGQFIFDFQKVSGNGGILNANCWAEVDGKHYVFGPDTIYVTDGTQQQSISNGLVNGEIYNTMNKNLSQRFFVAHNASLREVMFCFVSGNDVHFQDPTCCNRAAAFNYDNNTWTFYDLPNIAFITNANLDSKRKWNDVDEPKTWDAVGGTWYDQEHSTQAHLVGISAAWSHQGTGLSLPTSRIMGFDYLDEGSLLYEPDAYSNAPAWIERQNIDLDEQQYALNTQKMFHSIMPQIDISRDVPFTIELGAGLFPTSRVYEAPRQFKPNTAYKIDSRAAGRYLNMRFRPSALTGFKFSGFDLTVRLVAKR